TSRRTRGRRSRSPTRSPKESGSPDGEASWLDCCQTRIDRGVRGTGGRNVCWSSASRSEASEAAKWPPRSNGDRWTILFERSANARTERKFVREHRHAGRRLVRHLAVAPTRPRVLQAMVRGRARGRREAEDRHRA